VLSIPHSGVNYHPSAFGIEWLKLEPGSVPTPYILPDPAAEELKCSSAVWIGEQEAVMYSISATSVRGYVSFPISFMRESPMSARVEVYKKTGITKELVGSSESVPTSTVLDSDDHKLMLIVSINAISLGLTYENVSMVVTRVSVEM
jgi:hypothetical protein